jgi:predicted pyridoxine 5'-phosphate oxidase superfamily flavin-nucleotide-binding protein
MSSIPPSSKFHPGELAVQSREGVLDSARRVGASIGSTLPEVARDFLRQQRMVVVGSVDAGSGRVWGSLLTGEAGFVRAVDERTLHLDVVPPPGDPLHDTLRTSDAWGLLGIEFATRRRMKVKGRVEGAPGGGYILRAHSVYSLCPKYIQAREVDGTGASPPVAATVRRGERLTGAQRRLISAADTFFLCTFHPDTGADASHRGGNPGFVRVVDEGLLEFPDYPGNNMFNSLGNLELHPEAGLLFLDFEHGGTLHLSGKARASWEPGLVRTWPGARRVVSFQVEQVLDLTGASPLRWRFLQYSRFNPA